MSRPAMHAPPPVRMSLAPDRAWQAFVVACASVAGANVAAWAALHWQASMQTAALAALLAAALAGLVAVRRCRRGSATGVLAWDGANWQWIPGAAAPCPGEVRVMVDLGAWVLLRFAPSMPGQPAAWLATSHRRAGTQWSAWRAALYACRPSPGLPPMPDPT